MDSENRSKRDLPEVVSDILITLDKMEQRQERMEQRQDRMEQLMQQQHEQMQQQREQMQQQHEQMQQQHEQTMHAFNGMTTAVLDAMNRQTDRYDRTHDAHSQQEAELRELKLRVEGLEKTVYNKAS